MEAIASPKNDTKVMLKLFKSVIFLRFGVPRVMIFVVIVTSSIRFLRTF